MADSRLAEPARWFKVERARLPLTGYPARESCRDVCCPCPANSTARSSRCPLRAASARTTEIDSTSETLRRLMADGVSSVKRVRCGFVKGGSPKGMELSL